MVFTSGTILLVTIGGIVGYGLAPDPKWATLPVALMVVGTAVMAIPAAMLMQKVGRRLGFIIGSLLGASGAFSIVSALDISSFPLFCVAAALIGGSISFSQQFRFAGAESVKLEKTSFAVSFILLGSILGATIAPELVAYSAESNPQDPYTFAFAFIIGLYFMAILALLLLRTSAPQADEEDIDEPRPLPQLIRQPRFFVAVLAGMIGQGVMTYVMTATPISMNISDGFSIQETSEVIRAHVIAMYLPSLVTPMIIAKFGLTRVLSMGLIATSTTVVIGLAGHELLHYWFALVLLGIGWNFLFVGGTTLLVQSYRNSERFKSQALNDFSVFTVSAMASLLSGSILHSFGWSFLLSSAIPALALMAVAIFVLSRSSSD